MDVETASMDQNLSRKFASLDDVLHVIEIAKKDRIFPFLEEVTDFHNQSIIIKKLLESYDLIEDIGYYLSDHKTSANQKQFCLSVKNLILYPDLLSIVVLPSSEKIGLTYKECKLLRVLMEKYPECASREEISDYVWQDIKISPRSIDCHISRLRKRIEGASLDMSCVYGKGYRLVDVTSE